MFTTTKISFAFRRCSRILSVFKQDIRQKSTILTRFLCEKNLHRKNTIDSNSLHRYQHSGLKPRHQLFGLTRAIEANRNDSKRWVDVSWSDGAHTSYPYVWLRDNCQCPKCFHPTTKSRLVLMTDLDMNSQPTDVQVADNGNMKVTWTDGHESPYTSEWLLQRAFTDEARETRNEMYGTKHQHWGAELQDNIPAFEFDKILEDDNHFLEWMTEIQRYGLTLIHNTPREYGQLPKIADRVCYVRRTNYGDLFEVKSKVNPSNLAYTNVSLGLHTDLADCSYVPGVQFLHCVKNTSAGGRNQFADATYAAKIMQEEYPEAYEILCTKVIDYYDKGIDVYKYHNIARSPTFVRDFDGQVTAVRFNNQSRDSHLNMPIEDIQPLYAAFKKLNDIMYESKNHVNYTLKAGDIVVFDNLRIVHGREKYDIGTGGVRDLEGIFIDWDEICSRIRVLQAELGFM